MIEAIHDAATGRPGFLVDTSAGQVVVWTRGQPSGRLVIVIRGAFAPALDYEWLDEPGVQFAFLHLPGFHSPRWPSVTVAKIAASYGEAIALAFPGQPYMSIGISTGALVALSMPAARTVAIEPFFRTGHLWALFMNFSQMNLSPEAQTWVFEIFGAPGSGLDYRPILTSLDRPTIAVAGREPLFPPREIRELPSLVDDEDRAALRAHPMVTLTSVAGGHAISREEIEVIIRGAIAAF